MTDTGPEAEPADVESTPLELAQAIDATLDAADAAFDAGDIASAEALVTAAEETSDSLLEALGAPEAEID